MSYALPLAITAAVAFGAYHFGKFSKIIGENAKVGDVVDIPTASLPAGGLPAAIPQGVGYIAVKVQTASPTTITGPIVGYTISLSPRLYTPLPTPVGPVSVATSAVTRVERNGKLVAG